MIRRAGAALLALSAPLPAVAAPGAPDPPALSGETAPGAGYAAAGDIAARVAAMARTIAPGQGFLWQKLLESGPTITALEYWRKPGRPAVHPHLAEYALVVAGAGTLVSGGTLEQPIAIRPDLTEGTRIAGGTSRSLAPGDVILIPAGMPHWFGITGDRLVLLGTKLPAER